MAVVDVDTIAAYSGGLAAQVDWLGPMVGSHSALFCFRQMNRVNSGNGCHDDSTINIACLLLLLHHGSSFIKT